MSKKTEIVRIDSEKRDRRLEIKHPAEYLAFIKWIATPEPYREAKHQKDFAVSIRVDEDTLTLWKRREGFWDEVRKEAGEFFRDKTPNVMAAMYKRILGLGTAPEVRLWLEYIEGWRESQPFGGATQYDEIPDEEYILIKRVFNKNIDRRVPRAR